MPPVELTNQEKLSLELAANFELANKRRQLLNEKKNNNEFSWAATLGLTRSLAEALCRRRKV